MTERGLPIVDGAPACPFVAFDDDRDERATSPDHRHRCFAESPPAPRALAHQEAYCLSSAFPVCPTFQDWARREAARAIPRDVPPGDEDEGDLPPLAADRPPRRQGQGTWAAPPPWLRGGGAAAAGAAGMAASAAGTTGSGSGGPAPEPVSAPPSASPPSPAAPAGGLAGSLADRMASREDVLPAAPDAAAPAWAGHDAWDDELPVRRARRPRRPARRAWPWPVPARWRCRRNPPDPRSRRWRRAAESTSGAMPVVSKTRTAGSGTPGRPRGSARDAWRPTRR